MQAGDTQLCARNAAPAEGVLGALGALAVG